MVDIFGQSPYRGLKGSALGATQPKSTLNPGFKATHWVASGGMAQSSKAAVKSPFATVPPLPNGMGVPTPPGGSLQGPLHQALLMIGQILSFFYGPKRTSDKARTEDQDRKNSLVYADQFVRSVEPTTEIQPEG